MRKTFFIASAMLMTLLGCTNDMDNVAPTNDVTIIKATLDENPASRTNFTSAGKFFWTSNDLIKVYNTTGGFSEFEVIEGAGTGSATFSGVMNGQSTTCAVYPSAAAGSVSGTNLTISMPSTYWYKYTQSDYATVMEPDLNSVNVPMVAKVSTVGSTNFNFKNLAGVFCFKFKDVPANTAKIVFTANSKISGDFIVDLSASTPTISTSEVANPDLKSVAVAFTPSSTKTDRVAYFPVPCGTYNGFKIEMYDESDKKTAFMSSDKSKTIDRSKALVYNEITVSTITGGIEDEDTPSDPYNGHEYVDLGLPSGLKWATCNIGADKPGDYGDYFAWGETATKSSYDKENSSWYGVYISELQTGGVIDSNGNLTSQYDAASVIWECSWRMPTKSEIEELCNECTWTWETQDGNLGYRVTGSNGMSIFLPAAGCRSSYGLGNAGSFGFYWSATACSDGSLAYVLYFSSSNHFSHDNYRYYGQSVRPVTE